MTRRIMTNSPADIRIMGQLAAKGIVGHFVGAALSIEAAAHHGEKDIQVSELELWDLQEAWTMFWKRQGREPGSISEMKPMQTIDERIREEHAKHPGLSESEFADHLLNRTNIFDDQWHHEVKREAVMRGLAEAMTDEMLSAAIEREEEPKAVDILSEERDRRDLSAFITAGGPPER